MDSLFFDDWHGIYRVAIVTVLAYIAIIFIIRVSGKRTLAQMKAFDFIVTVALGASLATVALNKQVPLAEGIVAFLIFILLQFLVTWTSVRIPQIRNFVTADPSLLLYKGELLRSVMKKERIAQEDLLQKIRDQGYSGYESLDAVILETTGDVTIIQDIHEEDTRALKNVKQLGGSDDNNNA